MKADTEKRLAERLGEIHPCVLCGEPADHKHTDGDCCGNCCALWGCLVEDKAAYAWIGRIWKRNVALWQLCGELMEEDGWVKCSKRLPKVGTRVLVWYRGDTWTARLSDEGRHYKLWLLPTGHAELKEVSHWRPLPHPPEGN